MNEFLNIDWNPPIEDLLDHVFIDDDRMKRESVMHKILRGSFTDPFPKSQQRMDKEWKATPRTATRAAGASQSGIGKKEKEISYQQFEKPKDQEHKYVPGLMKLPFKLPRYSELNEEQHALCVQVLLQFARSEKPAMTQANRDMLNVYNNLTPIIRKEQEEFSAVAKKNWDGTNLKLVLEDYVNLRWKRKVQDVKELGRYYIQVGNVALTAEKKIDISAESTLLEMGDIPRVILPTLKQRFILRDNFQKLCQDFPPEGVFPIQLNSPILRKVPVSQDPNCERLAETSCVDLVISSGGLNCLANNVGPQYASSWMLPVVVKEQNGKTVVYIDKPLPRPSMTVPQKNAWAYKYLLKTYLIHPDHPSSISMAEIKEQEDDTFGNMHSNDILKLEDDLPARKKIKYDHLFESEKDNVKSQPEDKTKPIEAETENAGRCKGITPALPEEDSRTTEFNNGTETLSVSKSDGIVSSLYQDVSPECGNAVLDKTDDVKKCDFKKTVNPEVEKHIINEDEPLKKSAEVCPNLTEKGKVYSSSPDEKIKDDASLNNSKIKTAGTYLHPAPGCNIAYRVFKIGSSVEAQNQLMKTAVKEDYRILVRSKIDGFEKMKNGLLRPVMLAAKLEHQVALGAETVTAEEALKQWSTVAYRPDTCLVRVRISAETAELLQMERRTPNSVSNEISRLYNVKPESSLVLLHNMLHELKTLKPGSYLVRHNQGNGAFATIYKTTDNPGKNVFDLHTAYNDDEFLTIPNTPWPPLDKMTVTPAQEFCKRMPAMYYPPKRGGPKPALQNKAKKMLTPKISGGKGKKKKKK